MDDSQISSSENKSEQSFIPSSGTPSISNSEQTYYHVTFVNYDDSVLYEADVLEGSEAEYKGEEPTKEEDDEFTYEFKGWDKENELKSVITNLLVTAEYEAVAKEQWSPIDWA